MGRTSDQSLLDIFERKPTLEPKKAHGSCKFCKWIGNWQTTNLRRHARNCVGYQSSLPSTSNSGSVASGEPLGADQELEFKLSAALACYYDNLPFNAFEPKKKLPELILRSNPAIKLPHRNEIAKKLLDIQYTRTVAKVNDVLAQEPWLNFCIDETTNIKHQRIQNICVISNHYGGFYQFSENIQDQTMDAERSAIWASESIKQALGNRPWSDVNSLVTDTCAT
jgi:hypothetical protein